MKINKDKKALSATITMPNRTIREEALSVTTAIRGLSQDGFTKIILDFSQTSMIDSAALGALIHARREFSGIDFSIAGASGYVLTVLENARIHTIFSKAAPFPGKEPS